MSKTAKRASRTSRRRGVTFPRLDGNPMLCLATRQALGRFREEGSRLHLLLIWACMQALGRFHKEGSQPPPHIRRPFDGSDSFRRATRPDHAKKPIFCTPAQPKGIGQRRRRRRECLPTSAKAGKWTSTNVGEGGEMGVDQHQRRRRERKKGRLEADPTS